MDDAKTIISKFMSENKITSTSDAPWHATLMRDEWIWEDCIQQHQNGAAYTGRCILSTSTGEVLFHPDAGGSIGGKFGNWKSNVNKTFNMRGYYD